MGGEGHDAAEPRLAAQTPVWVLLSLSGVPSDPEAEDLAARVRSVLEIPLHRFLDITLADPDRPVAGIVLPAEEPALNNAGVLHGGVLTALLDVASYLAVLPVLARGENAVTHDLTASLMSPVAPGARVQIAGTILRRGRRVVFLRTEATVGSVVVAAGHVTKTIVAPPA